MKRPFLLSLLLMLLCSCSAYGYLYSASSLENNFAIEEGEIQVALFEPSWNSEKALGLVPGLSVPKDPLVKNTSTKDAPILVAAELRFCWGDGKTLTGEEMAYLTGILKLDYEADEGSAALWKRYAGEDGSLPCQHFYYVQALKRNLSQGEGKGDETLPLFTHVSVPSYVRNLDYAPLQQKGGFRIEVRALALPCQNQEEAQQEAYAYVTEGAFAFGQ